FGKAPPSQRRGTYFMIDKPPASIALDSLGIPHRLFRHERPVSSFEEAASARGQRPEQIVRSILFQVRPGEFVMVLMAGPDQIDWKKLRGIVKRSRVRMATEDEVLEVTGYRVGTVSPFGLKNQARPEFDRRVRVMIDASVFREEEISIGSGVRNTAIIMQSEDVRKALGDVEIVSLSGDSPS
ncbi:MAG TPA: YbaK/EbsC family protein, partial [Anaerolineales bacterium]|nr:YbaK/EbsC family protein [Anaerolineales bacterium]